MSDIDMSKLTEYITLDKQLFLDAEKYSKRAIEYLAEGKLSHAAGCLAKACKKLNKAERHKEIMLMPIPYSMIAFADELANRIAKNIMEGNEPSIFKDI